MPTKTKLISPEIYQLKVTLLGTKPPIWRRILVPANMTMVRLHAVLQAAMGWHGGHMHEFSIGDERRIGARYPDDGATGMGSPENEERVRLSSVVARVGAKLLYTYDFGDNWEHGIVLEKRLPMPPNMTFPVCIDGQLACPPDDCGGIPGFYDFLEAINDPEHEQHEELLEWVGGHYDPQDFSVGQVNQRLSYMHRGRKAQAMTTPG